MKQQVRSEEALTLFKSALSCADEGDLVGVHHVMSSVFQEESEAWDFVPGQGSLLTGVPEALKHDGWKNTIDKRQFKVFKSLINFKTSVSLQYSKLGTFSTAGTNCFGTLVPIVWSSNSSLVKSSGSRGSRTPITLPYCPEPPLCFLWVKSKLQKKEAKYPHFEPSWVTKRKHPSIRVQSCPLSTNTEWVLFYVQLVPNNITKILCKNGNSFFFIITILTT